MESLKTFRFFNVDKNEMISYLSPLVLTKFADFLYDIIEFYCRRNNVDMKLFVFTTFDGLHLHSKISFQHVPPKLLCIIYNFVLQNYVEDIVYTIERV